jgi:hypothetical protein
LKNAEPLTAPRHASATAYLGRDGTSRDDVNDAIDLVD